MEYTARMFRHNGQWVIEMCVEDWVISDILFDNDRKTSMPVKVIVRKDQTEYGGTTRFRILDEPKYVTNPISADVKFHVEDAEPEDE